MTLVAIDSLDDPRLDPYRDLRRAKPERETGRFVCEGKLLVDRLLASRHRVESILIEPRWADEYSRPESRRPESVGSEPPFPVYVVPQGVVERVIGFNFHRGILGCGVREVARATEEVLGAALASATWTIVACADVHDPENLGAILRTAAALGARGAVLSPSCADPFSRRVARVSMGSNLSLPIAQSVDLVADLMELRRRWQAEIVATVLDQSAATLASAPRPERVALVFGSEGHGLAAPLVAACDRRVTIRMSGADSLNVSVAAGIFLYHYLRPGGR